MRSAFADIAKVPGILAFPVMPQSIRSGGVSKPVQFVLLGNTYTKLTEWKEIIKAEARKNPGLNSVEDDYEITKPELKVEINNEKAADLGISIDSIGKSIETFFGSRNVTKFTNDGKEYNIVLQSEIGNRSDSSGINKIFVRSETNGKLIPLSSVISLSESAAKKLARYNRQRAVTISARLAGEYTLAEALEYLEKVVKEKLPAEVKIAYKGESEEYQKTNIGIYLIFILFFLTAYLSMAAQFESWKHPFIIMLTVPLAIFGGVIGLLVAGSSLNIYSQIGLIILIGLSAKNGILIVEFANQLRAKGMSVDEAIFESSLIRLRPVLMTTISTLLGAVPLVMSSGAGAESRYSMAIVVLGGITLSSLVTLYLVPALYRLIENK